MKKSMLINIVCGVLLLSIISEASALHSSLQRKASKGVAPTDEDLVYIQKKILRLKKSARTFIENYNFSNPWLLRQAFWHPSLGEVNNARFAWIGDQVLGLVVSELLYRDPAELTLEDMTLGRQKRVSRAGCAAASDNMGITQYLQIGGSLEDKDPTVNMKGELLEAVLGAIYQDSNFKLGPVQEVYAHCVAHA